MRIISQDGKHDFPYENVIIKLSDDGFVFANFVNGQPFLVAQYSSVEKAEKAMQMLHEAYTGAPFIMKNVEVPVGFAEQLKNMTAGFICVNSGEDNVRIEPLHMVFRFPQEDEI